MEHPAFIYFKSSNTYLNLFHIHSYAEINVESGIEESLKGQSAIKLWNIYIYIFDKNKQNSKL